ncbi:MAG: acyl-CoA dehydrogenase family protein [Acidimicrobiales bacterium]
MDFDLSDDQEALKEAASALLESEASIDKVRQAADRPDRIDRSLWSQMAEQGWLAIERPEEAGGLDMGFVEVAILCEQLGHHLAPVPFIGTVLALGALEHAVSTDSGTENAPVLDKLASGEAIGAIAWTRKADQVVASRSGNDWTLTGRPDPVVFGPVADVVLVPALVGGHSGDSSDSGARSDLSLFAVDMSAGASPGPEPNMDLTRSLGWLTLGKTPATYVGDSAALSALVDRAAVATAAEMLGSAEHVLDMTVQYAKDRVQFGRPIGSFQAVKHRCADMLVDVEGMRSAVYYAAWCIAAGNGDAPAAASAAKIWCSDAASRVMGSGLQVHGGIGFTWEHDLHFFVKRSQLDQVSFGTASWHRGRLAEILRPLAEAGLPVM